MNAMVIRPTTDLKPTNFDIDPLAPNWNSRVLWPVG
jgi:hypothetical protein